GMNILLHVPDRRQGLGDLCLEAVVGGLAKHGREFLLEPFFPGPVKLTLHFLPKLVELGLFLVERGRFGGDIRLLFGNNLLASVQLHAPYGQFVFSRASNRASSSADIACRSATPASVRG